MALTSLDGYIAAPKQKLTWIKTSSRTTILGLPFTMFDLTGYPAAGSFAIGNTANGVVPTSSTTGMPPIQSIANTGYISKIDYTIGVASTFVLYDRVFHAGTYSFNANQTLTAQPSYLSRMPSGSYVGTELWIEGVTAFTGAQTIQITYLDQDGNAGDTGAIATGVTYTVGRMLRVPLALGDSGISQINSIVSTISTAGTFNVCVMRPLCTISVNVAGTGGTIDMLSTGLPIVYQQSALQFVVYSSTTSSSTQAMQIEITDA